FSVSESLHSADGDRGVCDVLSRGHFNVADCCCWLDPYETGRPEKSFCLRLHAPCTRGPSPLASAGPAAYDVGEKRYDQQGRAGTTRLARRSFRRIRCL